MASRAFVRGGMRPRNQEPLGGGMSTGEHRWLPASSWLQQCSHFDGGPAGIVQGDFAA